MSCVRDVLAIQASGSKLLNQTGTKALMTQISVAITSTQIVNTTVTPLTNCGMLFIKNLDATNFVELCTDTNFTTNIYAKLNAGDFCLIPVNKAAVPTVFAKAGTAAVNVLVAICEI